MPDILEPIFRGIVAIFAIIALTRMNGLRSFSKMSSFDFALTIATGSVLASTIMSTGDSVMIGLVSLATIFAVQATIAVLRLKSRRVEHLADNEPLLLMSGTQIIEDNLRAARVTRDDLHAKLREANVLALSQIRAVIMETTGEISVLHGPPDAPTDVDEVLYGVRRSAEEPR